MSKYRPAFGHMHLKVGTDAPADTTMVSPVCVSTKSKPAEEANYGILTAELNRAVQRYETENTGTTVLAIDVEPVSSEAEAISTARVQHWAEKIGELRDQWQVAPQSRGGNLFREIADVMESDGILRDLNRASNHDTGH